MAASTYASGTQATTVTTEHFLSSPNVAGTYTLHVDLSVLTATDRVEIRVYQLMKTAGTVRVVDLYTFEGVQVDTTGLMTDPVGTGLAETNAVRFSLKQTHGTSRNFDWMVVTY